MDGSSINLILAPTVQKEEAAGKILYSNVYNEQE